MATRLFNNLGEGDPSSCVISVGSWVVHTGESSSISFKLYKTFVGLLKTVVGQRIWLFPVWLNSCTN